MASFVSRLHKHGTSRSSSKVQVIILASEWGSSKGGLSTINRELAIQLAKFPCLQVTFFLPKCADEDKKAAESHGISIVVAKRRPGYKELSWLSFAPEHLKIDVVVGHGVKLGRQAQVIRESHKCKWVQVVHTDPEELGMFKGYENSISKGEQKHRVEKELCCMADFVVGVGPKLAEAFRKYLGSCKKHQDVFEFTPGIFDEFSSVQQIPDERKQCRVLVFGRGDEEDFKLKGFDIAAKAVAALSDTILVFVGSPHGKQNKIAKQFIDFGIPANRLRVRSYMEREALKELFYEVDLVLMPSRTEGFGLTGLEALSAGLPVLVSKNSGFGEALDSIQVGSIFVMDSEDHSTWTGAIKDIWDKDRRSRLDEVKTVRDFYAERYSWSEQCKHLVEKMIRLLDETSSNPEITAQAMKAREQNGNKDFAGAQGGHEKKRSLSDHQETFIRSSSGSTSDEFLPREGPDQPEEVSAGGAQGMRSRSNAVSRECRKPPTHAAREENPDQPSVSAGGAQGMRSRSNAVSRECRKPPTHAAREENQDQPSGAQGGHEKKRSLSDHQETFIRSSSGSTSDEFLPREGPDQPEEATGPQRKSKSRGTSLPNSMRKQPIHAVKEGYIGQDNSSLILNPIKVQDFGFCKCEVKLNDSIYSGRARLYTC
ncbi:D-inositol 3-phosphate glycosyltransferase-like isoform X2 [Acropora palmata]|uniref:D-inositol 3-phosphate glycosyltransferase-like isoform X2 n=1 Tax=Acropora palmata TaxID=6131 RepID=UPI003D9FEF5B